MALLSLQESSPVNHHSGSNVGGGSNSLGEGKGESSSSNKSLQEIIRHFNAKGGSAPAGPPNFRLVKRRDSGKDEMGRAELKEPVTIANRAPMKVMFIRFQLPYVDIQH